jgi:hypothetical protein
MKRLAQIVLSLIALVSGGFTIAVMASFNLSEFRDFFALWGSGLGIAGLAIWGLVVLAQDDKPTPPPKSHKDEPL